jgi:hypothetical protein
MIFYYFIGFLDFYINSKLRFFLKSYCLLDRKTKKTQN